MKTLSNIFEFVKTGKIKDIEYVDLGLPSGNLWAQCNLDAKEPWEYGKYFQWGYTDGSYKGDPIASHYDNKSHKYDKRSSGKSEAAYSRIGTLLRADDAASVALKGQWQIPTVEDFQELMDNTTVESATENKINGFYFISKKNEDARIFIPCGGLYEIRTEKYYFENEFMCVLSADLKSDSPQDNHTIWVFTCGSSEKPDMAGASKTMLIPVRPVLKR